MLFGEDVGVEGKFFASSPGGSGFGMFLEESLVGLVEGVGEIAVDHLDEANDALDVVAGVGVELACGDLGGSASEDAAESFDFFAGDADLLVVNAKSADLEVLAFGDGSGMDFVGMPTEASVFDDGLGLEKQMFGEVVLG